MILPTTVILILTDQEVFKTMILGDTTGMNAMVTHKTEIEVPPLGSLKKAILEATGH
jgi:hypothetical protein